MKNFIHLLLKIFLVSTVFSIVVYSVALNFKMFNLNENNFYDLFTSIHDRSVIAGTSRSRYFFNDESFDPKYNFKNFSFSIGMSPYDNSYTDFLINFIKQDSTKNNITILSVDPYSFPNDLVDKDDYFSNFEFKKDDFKKLNFEYILKEKITPFTIIESNIKNLLRIFRYGKNYQRDNRVINKNGIQKEILKMKKPNNLNEGSFKNIKKLIRQFNKTSKVILVRTPVNNEFYEFENSHSLNFNFKMDSLANKYEVKYLDLNKIILDVDEQFYDLYHLNKKYSRENTIYSMKIIDSIIAN
jgi:hypothetical protein